MYLKMKRSLQDQANDPALWEETVIDEDKVIPKDETPEVITKFQNVDKRVPTIFDRARMDATLNDMLSNQFKNAEENTEEKKYIPSLHKIHAKQFLEADLEENMNRWVHKEFKNFNEDARITEVVRITTDQPHALDFMEQIIVMRENDKPDSFSEADFKYLNKNDIEDLYYLCWNKKVNYRETNPNLALNSNVPDRALKRDSNGIFNQFSISLAWQLWYRCFWEWTLCPLALKMLLIFLSQAPKVVLREVLSFRLFYCHLLLYLAREECKIIKEKVEVAYFNLLEIVTVRLKVVSVRFKKNNTRVREMLATWKLHSPLVMYGDHTYGLHVSKEAVSFGLSYSPLLDAACLDQRI
ncbi:hypothetical protein Tco_1500767 [Tanacetum coccineum]